MQAAGYVLAGGASRRMGADKALLPFRGGTLIESVANAVREATGSVTIVGPRAKYERLGIRVIEDLRRECGPLAGLESALADSRKEWIVLAACDMPGVSEEFFRDLVAVCTPEFEAVVPVTPDGRFHPLAAAYRHTAKEAVTGALDRGVRKVLDAIQVLKIRQLPVSALVNTNTPEEWAAVAD